MSRNNPWLTLKVLMGKILKILTRSPEMIGGLEVRPGLLLVV